MNQLPDPGDLVWLDFNPQAGREQAGRRPAMVLSPRSYHEATELVVVCPITSNVAPYPFKVILPDGGPVSGAILVDQVRCLDRNARHIVFIGRAPEEVLLQVRAKLSALLGIT